MARQVAKPFRFHTRTGTISMSGVMFDRISKRVMRCNGAFAAKRGEYEGILNDLYTAVYEKPDHFNEQGRNILGYVSYEEAA
ncbi:hypothetical protein [Mesorhizobium sp.]|uniref:hypothetical protein n=1 Tax=Mesorhizobium sp. TaxID=1871066 RepID=UPI000FE71284|nr:hypothetical protein [Mesorhizobium sp.]RWI35541.1 MAG: hypothetical protein EOR14_28990 [Mesorhizobium sp.]RWJ66452.1 MAG: hypothetical protein EOR34_28980 [Mesorhizobium sp.]